MTTLRVPQSLPWRLNHLVVAYALNAAGLVALLASWFLTSGTVRDTSQVRWLVLGIGGVVISGATNAFWLLVGRSAVTARKRTVLSPILRVENLTAPAERCGDSVSIHSLDTLVAASGMKRFHRIECQLVDGKDVRAESLSEHHRAGRRPCGLCEP
jgi:hypothetical protein